LVVEIYTSWFFHLIEGKASTFSKFDKSIWEQNDFNKYRIK